MKHILIGIFMNILLVSLYPATKLKYPYTCKINRGTSIYNGYLETMKELEREAITHEINNRTKQQNEALDRLTTCINKAESELNNDYLYMLYVEIKAYTNDLRVANGLEAID